jgi:hypothetical protein
MEDKINADLDADESNHRAAENSVWAWHRLWKLTIISGLNNP